jgi:hypothetical protein
MTKKKSTRRKSPARLAVKRKPKPQLFIYTVSTKPKVTIIVSEGMVQDIIKENCPEVEVVVHDYDIQGMDVDNDPHLSKDDKGKAYLPLGFD